MKFWLLMVGIDLINPLTMIALGWYLLKSRKAREVFGFKTAMWVKNNDTEKFAYNFCTKYYFFTGIIMMSLSIIVMLLFISNTVSTIGLVGGIICTVQGFLSAGALLVTELALRKTFDKAGHRR